MLKFGQGDTAPLEAHSFVFEPEPLLQARFARKPDSPASSHNAVPGNRGCVSESPNHLPRRAGVARRRGDRSVGRNLAPGDSDYQFTKFIEHS